MGHLLAGDVVASSEFTVGAGVNMAKIGHLERAGVDASFLLPVVNKAIIGHPERGHLLSVVAGPVDEVNRGISGDSDANGHLDAVAVVDAAVVADVEVEAGVVGAGVDTGPG